MDASLVVGETIFEICPIVARAPYLQWYDTIRYDD